MSPRLSPCRPCLPLTQLRVKTRQHSRAPARARRSRPLPWFSLLLPPSPARCSAPLRPSRAGEKQPPNSRLHHECPPQASCSPGRSCLRSPRLPAHILFSLPKLPTPPASFSLSASNRGCDFTSTDATALPSCLPASESARPACSLNTRMQRPCSSAQTLHPTLRVHPRTSLQELCPLRPKKILIFGSILSHSCQHTKRYYHSSHKKKQTKKTFLPIFATSRPMS